jgi:hypothetical protein
MQPVCGILISPISQCFQQGHWEELERNEDDPDARVPSGRAISSPQEHETGGGHLKYCHVTVSLRERSESQTVTPPELATMQPLEHNGW